MNKVKTPRNTHIPDAMVYTRLSVNKKGGGEMSKKGVARRAVNEQYKYVKRIGPKYGTDNFDRKLHNPQLHITVTMRMIVDKSNK